MTDDTYRFPAAYSQEPDPDAPTLVRHNGFRTEFYSPAYADMGWYDPVTQDYPSTAMQLAPTLLHQPAKRSLWVAASLFLFPGAGRAYLGDEESRKLARRWGRCWLIGALLFWNPVGHALLLYAHWATAADSVMLLFGIDSRGGRYRTDWSGWGF